jgi:RNA-binding protein
MLQTPATSRSKSRKGPSGNDSEKAAPAPALTKRRLHELKAQAHHLEPIVQIGHGGLHDAAFAAVARALHDHELIKVRLQEPEDKRAMARQLAEAAGAALCGLVGHTVILYKPKPAKPGSAKKTSPVSAKRRPPRPRPSRGARRSP